MQSETITMPRLSATVMLLRDGATDLEVLLLKRHPRSEVHGGVFVFPGGKVDAQDAIAAKERFGDGQGLLAGFGEHAVSGPQAAILYAAALRELFEECGVLVDDIGTMHPYSQWVTPVLETPVKRFDTWFFLALLPSGASALHDGHEAVASIWLSPRDALTRYSEDCLPLATPQIMSLIALSRYRTAQAALDAARTTTPGRVQPEQVLGEAAFTIAFPGDPSHSIPIFAVPGPVRLVRRGGRMEPAQGMKTLFSWLDHSCERAGALPVMTQSSSSPP